MSFKSKTRPDIFALSMAAACLVFVGCANSPGRPGPGPEVVRPEEVVDFPTLYKQNCAACHGADGKNGAAISLSNPEYVALAGETQIRTVIAKGVPGKLMPAFAKSAGGMLTDNQVTALAQGVVEQWGKPSVLAGQVPPSYLATLTGNAEHGAEAFGIYCARCHGAAGEGHSADATTGKLGSIVEPSYLALISDQNLRSVLISGRPDQGQPDWRNDGAQPMTDQQITDIVAWLASKRVANPGQPYPTHP